MRLPSRSSIVLVCGSLILFLSIGGRQGFGLFLTPITSELGVGRESFAIAIAIQYLVWGAAGPIAGVVADRFGATRTLITGGIVYALGFIAASAAHDTAGLIGSAGFLIGLGLGGASYGVVHGVVGAAFPPERRGMALGVVGAATTIGQFLLLFVTQGLIEHLDWRGALAAHALLVALIVPLAIPLRAKHIPSSEKKGGGIPAIRQAAATPAFWLLCAGFAASGFQVMFTMTHLPAFVGDLGIPPALAVQALAVVSFFSFVGSWLFGYWADKLPKRKLLALIYFSRAVFALAAYFIKFSPNELLVYFAMLGIVWLCTIPVASALTAELFGTRFMASLFSVIFFTHQIGGFFGTWLGGRVYDVTGSYGPMWLLIAMLCGAGSLLALLIRTPVRPAEPQAAEVLSAN